jgi:hypothetical protein
MPDKLFTNEVLKAAIEGFEAQKQQIIAKIAELSAILAKKPEIGKSKRNAASTKPKRTGKKPATGRKQRAPKADGTSGTGPRKAVGTVP